MAEGDRGCIHVYRGDGKGKTTAALGLALRASGRDKNVIIIQFLKDGNTGELTQLARLPNITLLRGKSDGAAFVKDMTDAQKQETREIHNRNLKEALSLMNSGALSVLILDEALDAISLGLLDEDLARELIANKPFGIELVITGHKAIDWVEEKADYITEMNKVRHPYDSGISARRGIEF
jgi:cob(I)alamin adenosyltransferase